MMQEHQMLPLSQRELILLFDYYCNPQTPIKSTGVSQIVTGIQLPALILQAGQQAPGTMRRPLSHAMHQIRPANDDEDNYTTAARTKQ